MLDGSIHLSRSVTPPNLRSPKLCGNCEEPNMLRSMLACCKVYISESRNASALQAIEQAAKLHPEAIVINRFTDESYNRVGYTLVSSLATGPSGEAASPLRGAVFGMARAAFDAVDLAAHDGAHPRLGVIDHICFHPLAQATLQQVAGLARAVAADIGAKLEVPTFLYGAAHSEGRILASVRRQLGYFKPNSAGNQWAGALDAAEPLPMRPEEGPSEPAPSKGVLVVGATAWVDNYNVPVHTSDAGMVRRIARRAGERGGGLRSVQAMGLAHGEGVAEVACNLLDPGSVGADQVQAKVRQLAEAEGLAVGEGYYTDFSREKIVELYLQSTASK